MVRRFHSETPISRRFNYQLLWETVKVIHQYKNNCWKCADPKKECLYEVIPCAIPEVQSSPKKETKREPKRGKNKSMKWWSFWDLSHFNTFYILLLLPFLNLFQLILCSFLWRFRVDYLRFSSVFFSVVGGAYSFSSFSLSHSTILHFIFLSFTCFITVYDPSFTH